MKYKSDKAYPHDETQRLGEPVRTADMVLAGENGGVGWPAIVLGVHGDGDGIALLIHRPKALGGTVERKNVPHVSEVDPRDNGIVWRWRPS